MIDLVQFLIVASVVPIVGKRVDVGDESRKCCSSDAHIQFDHENIIEDEVNASACDLRFQLDLAEAHLDQELSLQVINCLYYEGRHHQSHVQLRLGHNILVDVRSAQTLKCQIE